MPRGVYDRKPKTKTEDIVPDTGPTIDTPPAPVDPDPAPDAAEQPPAEGDLCALCWAAGWPENGDAAECEHGTWQR
jgi:hypothetical protein